MASAGLVSPEVVMEILRVKAALGSQKVVPAVAHHLQVMVVVDPQLVMVAVEHQERVDRLQVTAGVERQVVADLLPVMVAVALQVGLVSEVVPEAGWDLVVVWGLAVEWVPVAVRHRKTFLESCHRPSTNL